MTVLATALTEELDTSATSSINFSKAPTVNGDPVAVVTGTVARATALATPQNITIGGVTRSFNGTTGIVWTLSELGALGSTATAASATKLATTRTINGTNFDGTANITTSTWGSARNFTIGSTTKSVNGGSEVTWTLSELGAFPATGGTFTGDVTISKSTPRLELVNTASSNKAWNIDVSGTNLRISESGISARLTLAAGGAGTYTGVMNFTQPPTVGGKPIYYEGNEPSTPEIPYPDVWIPFSSNLNMLEGYGDEIQVGGYTVATRASFTRASTATYIDKSGTLRTAAVNEPRFEKEGLLIEGQSTNLHPYSVFSLVPSVSTYLRWGSGATGSKENDNMVFTVTSDLATLVWCETNNGSVSLPPGTYTLSVFVEELPNPDYTYIPRFMSYDGTTDAQLAVVSEGWKGSDILGKRVSITATTTATSRIAFRFTGKSGEPVVVGDRFVISKPQIEALPFATSYIPTTGAAATRAGDVCYVPRVGNYNRGPLTFSLELDYTKGRWTYFNPVIIFDSTNVGKRIQLNIPSNQDQNRLRFEGESVYVDSGDLSYSGPVACRLTTNQASICTGGNIATVTSTSDFSHDGVVYDAIGIGVGTRADGAPLPSSSGRSLHIRNFRIWHRALSDQQLRSLR